MPDRPLTPEEIRRIRDAADHHPDPVERARAIRAGMTYWSILLEETVAQAREQGVSWAEIADALGVSRQAAAKRFRVDIVEDS